MTLNNEDRPVQPMVTCPSECAATNHPGTEHEEWIRADIQPLLMAAAQAAKEHSGDHPEGAWPPSGQCPRCDALQALWNAEQRLFDAPHRTAQNRKKPEGTTMAALPDDHPVGMFEWSAFGANYPDTSCDEGICTDHDGSWTSAGIPCPFCLPAKFYEYQWGGGWVVPTCYECQEKLPPKTPLTFHDGPGLTFSADCPRCQAHTTTLMREYETDRDDVEVWVAE